MGWLTDMFGKKQKPLPTRKIELLDVNDPRVAASLLVMHFVEDNFNVSKAHVASFLDELPDEIADVAQWWVKIYLCWYFFALMCRDRKAGFGDAMLTELSRLFAKLDEQPDLEGIGALLLLWFERLHAAVERGPVEVKGVPVPFEIHAATIFLYFDNASPLHEQSETNMLEFDLANVLIQARDTALPSMDAIRSLGKRLN